MSKRIIEWILRRISDNDLKQELRRRGYATDISIIFESEGKQRELVGVGKLGVFGGNNDTTN